MREKREKREGSRKMEISLAHQSKQQRSNFTSSWVRPFQWWLLGRPHLPETGEFQGSVLTSEFLQGGLSTLGVVAGLHGHTP